MAKPIEAAFIPIVKPQQMEIDIENAALKAAHVGLRLKSTEVLPLPGTVGGHPYQATLLLIFES